MDWTLIVIVSIFFLVGIFFVFLGRRFGVWFMAYGFEHNLNFTIREDNKRTSTLSKEEYIRLCTEGKGFRRTIWSIWLTGIRILGMMFITASIFILIFEIFHIQ